MKEKIEKSNVQEIIELNMIQKGMLFHYLKEINEVLYNAQLSFLIQGELDEAILRNSFKIVQSKNDVLRSVFRWKQISKPLQIILKDCPIDFSCHDISHLDNEQISEYIKNYSTNDFNKRFDLAVLPLRLRLIKTSSHNYLFYITHHHILYDGWSTGILIKELFECYSTLVNNRKQYIVDKVDYKNVMLTSYKENDKAKEYWDNYLNGYEIESLFLEQNRSSEENTRLHNLSFTISKNTIEVFAKKHKVTLASIIYASFGILIQKYFSSTDFIFGTTVSVRNSNVKGSENTIGNFINTIPLRFTSIGELSLIEIINDINKHLIERNDYIGFPYAGIKELQNLKPDENLFDTVIVIENYPLDELVISDLDGIDISLNSIYENTEIPLLITVLRKNEELEINFSFRNHNVPYFNIIGEHLIRFINNLSKFCERKVNSINILSDKEVFQQLSTFNDTETYYPREKTIIDLFEEQVSKNPENIAFSYGDNCKCSYAELKDKMDKVASYLKEEGIGPGNLVGVMINREEFLIPIIYGVLKSGAAYVPIDPNNPVERINSIIDVSNLEMLITRDIDKTISVKPNCKIIDLDEAIVKINSYCKVLPSGIVNSNSLAYVIFTSGSTGKPKGVMIEHHSIVNRLLWMQKEFPLNCKDIILQKTPIVFDVSVWELFWWSFTGASLHLLYPGEEKQPQKIIEVIEKNRITTAHFVHSMLGAFLFSIPSRRDYNRLESLRQVFSSGEALKTEHVKLFNDKINNHSPTHLINLYGPTEATVDVSCHICK
ncbi:MAG: AMP-binding protein, partial [Asgard group archaeon]|nr:AMP-binding protein [Asgard group archaeon]